MPDPPPTLSDIENAPETLPVPVDLEVPEVQNEDWQARFAEIANENFNLKTEVHALRQKLGTKAAIDSLMAPYANKVFWFLCGYCVFAFVLLTLCGYEPFKFDLPETTLGLVVGSTAVSAIGLVGLVIRGIFKSTEVAA